MKQILCLVVRRQCVGVAIAFIAAGLLCGCGKPRGSDALKAGAEKLQRGNLAAAVRLLEQASNDLREPPLRAKALNFLGMAYAQQGRLDKAEETLAACVQTDPDLEVAYYNLGLVCFQLGKFEKARNALVEFTKKNRDHYVAYCHLASCYLRTGDHELARSIYGALEQKVPEDNAAYRQVRALVANGLGVICAQRGQHTEAAKWFQESLRRDSGLAEPHLNLAVLNQATLSNKKEALLHYRRFLALRPDALESQQVRQLVEELQRELAPPPPQPVKPAASLTAPATVTGPTHTDALQKSIAELRMQIKAHADARRNAEAAACAVQLGELLRVNGDTTNALAAFQQALSHDPKNFTALLRTGGILDSQGNPRALGFYRQAAESGQVPVPVLRRMIGLARQTGDYDTVIVACRKLIALDKDDADSLHTLAVTYDQDLKRTTEALGAYQEFAKRFPNDARAEAVRARIIALDTAAKQPAPPKLWPRRQIATLKAGDREKAVAFFNEGVRAQQQEKFTEAITQYEKAINADPTFAKAYFNLGCIHQSRGDYENAIAAYELAVQAQPDYLSARLNMALSLKAADYTQDAIEQFKSVLSLNADEAGAHLELGNLYARDPATRDLARQHYQRFVELAPSSPAAREVRRWLATEGKR